MIEITNIVLVFFFWILLINNFYFISFFENFLKLKNLSLMEYYSINFLFIMKIFLIISFVNVNYFYLSLLLITFSILSLFSKSNSNKLIKFKKFYDLIIIFSLTFILSTDLIANPNLEWDGHTWYFHALNFKENLNFFNLAFLPQYNQPHLGGIFWGLTWDLSFNNNEAYGRIFYIILYLIALGAAINQLKIDRLKKTIILIVLIFITYDNFLFKGYQEVLVFSILVIITNLLSTYNVKKLQILQLLFLILSSSLLLWTKNEGSFYFIIIILYLMYNQNNNKKILIFISGVTLIYTKHYLILLNSPLNDAIFTFNFLLDQDIFFQKLSYIILHIFIGIFKYPIWILFILLYMLQKNRNFEVIYYSLSSLIFIFFTYLFIDIEDYKWLITGSLDRLLFQSSGFLVVFVCNSLASYFRYFENNKKINN